MTPFADDEISTWIPKTAFPVHADASNFASGVTKEQAYEQVLLQAEGLFNLSNVASLLWHAYHSLPSPSSSVNWSGFYVLDPKSTPAKPSLILGPFQGKVACQTIPFGRGVCGAAASTRETQLVPDVDAFPGHIACDGDSRSEIVVPIVSGGKLVAIIDVDCAEVNGFDDVDRVWLEKLAVLLAEGCDW
ncbi:gaf domain nucleotide-binding protein [Colletotrichum plurivorum]|uniref:Gaf domain nucleotide-binding protein n=1 Tax=Colletotrichum plurivorum TaxID=2175906 RepID=A0A8H6KXL8_9PEZI|nr:gaf domain nucleotide-binding protein [Colletotrichum plurivorum]